MKYARYQHVERWGNREVEGIEQGKCYIFPKLDGTNGTIWLGDDGEVWFGSRNFALGNHDNQGFKGALRPDPKLEAWVKTHPRHRIYGEWLVPHTIKRYLEDAWRKFYIFDVTEENEDGTYRYLPFEEYAELLKDLEAGKDEFDRPVGLIEIIPPLSIIENPTVEQLLAVAARNTYLMAEGVGEGVVIKRYDFVNKYGAVTWAKVVIGKEDDITKNAIRRAMRATEVALAEKYVKGEDIDKVKVQIEATDGPWRVGPMIPKLLGIYYHTFITENIWEMIKKSPKIDFASLRKEVIERVKMVRKELFR